MQHRSDEEEETVSSVEIDNLGWGRRKYEVREGLIVGEPEASTVRMTLTEGCCKLLELCLNTAVRCRAQENYLDAAKDTRIH